MGRERQGEGGWGSRKAALVWCAHSRRHPGCGAVGTYKAPLTRYICGDHTAELTATTSGLRLYDRAPTCQLGGAVEGDALEVARVGGGGKAAAPGHGQGIGHMPQAAVPTCRSGG